jgi:hypothetical protein
MSGQMLTFVMLVLQSWIYGSVALNVCSASDPALTSFLDSVFRRGIELFDKRNASFKRNGTERCQMMIELNYLNLKPPTRLVLFWTPLLQDPVRHRILWQVSSC